MNKNETHRREKNMVVKDTGNRDMVLLASRIAALEELLDVYEKSVLEQTDKLYKEIAERKRTEERLKSAEEDLTKKTMKLRKLTVTSSRPSPRFCSRKKWRQSGSWQQAWPMKSITLPGTF